MNYYNDNDKYSVKWLKSLIDAELIPQGEVDDRSIKDVKPSDLKGFTQCHFFAGIGGWPYALRLADWPEDRPVWTGSCPCQPFSIAGKSGGTSDDRHLWPAFRWLIAQCRPPVVLGEQVASPLGRKWLSGVRLDLEAMGYAVGAADLCSAGVGAPNIRQRLWWVADAQHAERRPVNVDRKNGCDREDEGWQKTYCELGTCGEVRRLGDTNSTGPQQREQATESTRQRNTAESTIWLGHPSSTGLPERIRVVRTEPSPIGTNPWEASQLAMCRDGKLRRIPLESEFQLVASGLYNNLGPDWIHSSFEDENQVQRFYESYSEIFKDMISAFPLCKRIPGRVGVLRGAGNAINPWVAGEFIKAYQSV